MSNTAYNFDELNRALKSNSNNMEYELEGFLCSRSSGDILKLINDAQKYSLLGSGKRIRPFLTNEVCKMLGGDVGYAVNFAMAVEMIHTYSLIHDDLPCMDNDDMRRGRPSNHKRFDEATAVLAGDALLTNAFLAASTGPVTDVITAKAVMMIAEAAGDNGMIGGQIIDMEGEKRRLSFDELLLLHSLKTGKMIELSAALGCISAGYDEDTDEFEHITAYARGIGLVFQIIDDILDVEGDEQVVGKTLCSDAENEKTTFLSFFTVEEARAYAKKVSDQAIRELDGFDNKELLVQLAQYLLVRSN